MRFKYFILLLLIFPSCIKEDLSKISDVEANAEWIVPLLDVSVGVLDVLPEDEHFVVDEDSLLRIVFRDENIKTIYGDSLFVFSEQEAVKEDMSIGVVDLDDFESAISISLGEMAEEMEDVPDVIESLTLAAQNDFAYFTPINSQYGGEYGYMPFDNFEYVQVNSGQLSIEITNDLPVEIQSIKLGLINLNTEEVVANFDYENIGLGQTVSDTSPLENALLYNEVAIEIIQFITEGSGPDPLDVEQWVEVNLSDELHFSIFTQNMNVNSGKIIYPDVNMEGDTSTMSLDLASDIDLNEVVFETGILEIKYNSTIHHPIEAHIQIPNLYDNGVPFSEIIPISNTQNSGSVTIERSIVNNKLDMTSNLNQLEFNYSGTLESNGELVEFDVEDFVELEVNMKDLKFAYVEGYFGQTVEEIDAGEIDLEVDFIERFGEGVILTNPQLFINSSSNIGLPIDMNLEFIGQSESGDVDLEAETFSVNTPSIEEGNITVFSTSEFNSSNSNLVNLINSHPSSISFSGKVITNPEGNVSTNFIYSNSEIRLGFEMDIPIDIKVDDLSMTDTVKINLEDDEDVEAFDLRVFVSNDFPINAGMKLYFMDTVNNITLDSLLIDEIQASTVNADGVVDQPAILELVLNLDSERIDAIKNSDQAIAQVELSSLNEVSNSVKIYTDYRFKASVGLVLKIQSGSE